MSFSQTFRKVATAASEIAKAAGGVAQPQPTVAMPSASNVSARQRLLYQPTQDDKWYSGDAPTSSDIMARIFTIGKTNPEESKQLFATYQTMQADPSSPIYNPYTKSTNKAVDELVALGADVSRGIDDKWLASYDWLKNHYRMETGNTPLAPSSKSSTEENAAYWYYRVLQAEPTTKKAEQEWEALQEEISYWAGRADRNYSDDEVLAKIDWSSYPTLVGMDEDAAKGLPTVLNRPVGYSQDALRGVVWAARNGGDKADPYNSVRAALGQGNTWQENADISAMLDPTNERYNPYAVGSTLDDAALYFGVSSFDQKWLDDNRGVLSGNDETAKRYYQKVYDAEQTTQKAEAELADLREYVNAFLQNNGDPSMLLEYLLDDYPTLQAMQTSLESGDLKATTRAINFSLADITAEVNQRVAEKNAEKASADTKMQGAMGVIDRTYSAMTGNTQAVESGKTAAATMAASTIMEQGTPEEQIVFRTAYSADFMTRCQELNAAIETGAPNLAGEYNYSLQLTNDYTSQHYFGILEGMRPYEAIQEEIAKIEQEIDAKERLLYNIPDVAPGTGGTPWKMQQVDGVWYQFGAELDPATREWKLTGVWNEDSPGGEVSDAAKAAAQTWISGLPLEPLSEEEAYTNEQELSVLKQKLQVARNELKAAEPAYSKAAEQNEAMTQAYDTLARLRELTGVEAGNATGYRALMEDLYTVGAEYKPTEWLPYNPFENLLSDPKMSVELVSKIAEVSLKSYGTEITRLQKMLDTAKEFGIDIPDKYVKNIDREIARLGRLSKDAEYFLLAQNPDVRTVAEDVRSKVWKDVHENGKGWGILPEDWSTEPSEYNGYYRLDYEAMFDALYWSSTTDVYELTDEERDLYLYIRETQGFDAAYEYYYHLTNDSYGIIHQRGRTSDEELAQKVRENPVLANLGSILTSPLRLSGVLYSLEATLKGEEINPNNAAFAFVDIANVTKEQSKQMINEELGEGTAAAWWANLGYDAAVAAGESLVNMAFTGGTGALAAKGTTVAAKFGFKVLAGISTAAPMGLQAAASAIQDAKYRGADDAQAWALAGATFVAETFTEAITVGNLRAARGLASGAEVKSFIKTLIPSMLEEGFGESMSEAITSLSDDWIMGELSNRNAIIQAAIDDGMTLEEAEDFATKKILNNILYAGATGMLSSAATTTAGHVAGKLNPDDPEAGLPKAEVAGMETDQATETEDGMPLMQESFGPEEQKKEADQKAKNELSKSVTALTAAATADEASQTATISAVLTADNASHGVEATAAAAAQHMVADMGGARATVKLSSILLTAAENGIPMEAVKVAVSTAALTNGPAHEALMENRRAATPEYVNNLIALAGQEMTQPEAVKQIRQAVNDNRVAMKVSEAASEGAFAEVVPFEDAVNQAKANRRIARAALEREQKTAQTMGQSLQSLNAEFIEDPTNQMVRGSVQQAIKDVEGQAKVVQEYEQSLTNAEESLHKAERDLTTKRRSLLTNLRMQAQAAVNEEQQAEQESKLQNAPAVTKTTLETEEATQKSTEDIEATDPDSESGTGGQGSQTAAPVIQYAKASSVTPTTKNTTDVLNRKLASAQQIAKSLTKKLGVGDYIGTSKMNRVPQGVRGYYETRAKYIAVPGKQAGNYATTMHELGHAIAHKIGMTGTDAMVNALDPVFAANYTDAELPGEAFAEFFALYSVDEASARNFAGDDFVDAFQRKLKQTGLNKDVQKAVDQLRVLHNASVNEQIGSTIRSRADKQKIPFKAQWDRLKAGAIDRSAAAEKVNHEIRKQSGSKEISLNADIRKMALLNNFANRRAYTNLTKNRTDSHGDIIGDALAKVLADAGLTAKNEKLFERYMLALHSLARDEQGKHVFDEHLTKSAREAFIKQVEQEHPEIKKAEEAFQTWRKAFLQAWMVDTGYISQAAFDAMNAMYEHYVPTRRVKDPRFIDQNRSGGRKYQIRTATGSTEDIWSPIDTFVDMVQSIVSMVSQNNVALAWDTAYRTYSLGEFGRAITPDSHQVSVDTTELRDAIEEKLSGDVDEDLMQEVLDLIGEKQTQWVTEVGSKAPNTLVVQRPDGTHGVYTIADPELFKLLAGVNEARIDGNPILVALAKLTRGMTALTTGSNPIFAFRNALRDFQNSVNYGSWASNYITAVPKWVKSFYEVWSNSGDFQDYMALGGGGWTRVETGSKKGNREIRSELYKGYAKSSLGRAASHATQKIWNAITLTRLNEIIEQTSRFAEYKYGKHDLSTQEGRSAAFLDAQDVTVDFARMGNNQVAGMLKAVVPFFNASLQGVYRTGRMLTEAERGRAPARFAKTVINYALMSALANGILMKFLGDDEKEEYAMLSDDMKSKHLYFPNIAPDILGNDPLIRVPLGQDPLGYAVHGLVSNAMWSGQTDDDFIVEISAIANTILDNMNPLGSGTVLEPLLDTAKNTTWYGSPIVPARMESWAASTQYDETTPELFKFLGRVTNTSPLAIQYLAEQYTGFAGQMLIPALSVDENTGELGGLNAAIASAQKRLTSDPLVSNDVVSSFYDGADMLTEVTKAVDNTRPLNTLRRGLTHEEAAEAYDVAKEMLSKDGIIGGTKKRITDLYNEIDAINANTSLSDDAKYAATREVRRKILELAVDANEAIGAFKEQYVTGDNLVMRMLTEGTTIQAPTAYDRMEQTFKDDEQQPYMQRASEVYKATGSDSALPHPNTGFSVKDKITKEDAEYVVEPEYWNTWVLDYKSAYVEYLAKNGRGWEMMTDAQKLDVLKKAHSAGHEAAKKRYAKIHGIKLND